MTNCWIRQLAFWAALILALCILDSRIILGAHAPVGPKERDSFVLTVLPVLSPSADGRGPLPDAKHPVAWTAEIFREENPGQEQPSSFRLSSFRSVGVLKGKSGEEATRILPQGNYWLVTRAEGFARVVERFELRAHMGVEPVLQAASTLLVRVVIQKDDRSLPLAAATILVGSSLELPFGAQTNAAGEAEFSDLLPGSHLVRIFAPGYEPYEGQAESELLVRLRPVTTLRVSVVHVGEAQAEARVFIAGVQLWPARSAKTDGKGAVDITGLKPGRYALYASKGMSISPTLRNVEVLGTSGIVEVKLELGPGRRHPIAVQRKADHSPIEGARVTWSSSGLGQFSRHGLSDSQGRVILGPLNEAGGVLSLRADGFVTRLVPAVVSDEEKGEQLVELVMAASVEGRILDPEGFPVEGATVEVVGTDIFSMPISVNYQSESVASAHFDWSLERGQRLMPAGELGVMLGPVPPIPLGQNYQRGAQRLTSDDRGYFRAEGVPPGEVVVLVRHRDFMDGRSGVLRLSPGGRGKTEVRLGRGQRLRGRVLDHAGFPVAYARVQVSSRKFERRITAESDGSFELGAAPEKVTLSISRIEEPLRTVFSHQVLASERAVELEINLPEPRPSARIHVFDEQGAGVELCQLTLFSLEKEFPLKETRFTSEGGVAQFPETRGLRVKVRVKAPGFVEEELELQLEEDNRITAQTALRATGRVTGVRGRLPASGAKVLFKAGGLIRRATADEYGEYRLTGLPPGRGELFASHEEFGSARLAVSLDDQGREESRLSTIDLSPTIQLSGRVQNSQGKALSGVLISLERLSPYLTAAGRGDALGVSNAEGMFTVSAERSPGLHLYGAQLGVSFGWSDEVVQGDQDRVEGLVLLVDQEDKAGPDALGTLLVGLSGAAPPRIYAIAMGSRAARSGLRVDDELVEIDGETPRDLQDARNLLSGLPGTELHLRIRRGAKIVEILVSREHFMR